MRLGRAAGKRPQTRPHAGPVFGFKDRGFKGRENNKRAKRQLTVTLWCLGLAGSADAKSSISGFQFTQAESFPEDFSCSAELQGLAR